MKKRIEEDIQRNFYLHAKCLQKVSHSKYSDLFNKIYLKTVNKLIEDVYDKVYD